MKPFCKISASILFACLPIFAFGADRVLVKDTSIASAPIKYYNITDTVTTPGSVKTFPTERAVNLAIEDSIATSVLYADEAGHAADSDTATTASYATTALGAESSTESVHAALADNATTATYADTATTATRAETSAMADLATTATTALYAETSEETTHALTADTATTVSALFPSPTPVPACTPIPAPTPMFDSDHATTLTGIAENYPITPLPTATPKPDATPIPSCTPIPTPTPLGGSSDCATSAGLIATNYPVTPLPTCTPKPDATPIPTPTHVDTCTTATYATSAGVSGWSTDTLLFDGLTTEELLAAVPVPTPQATCTPGPTPYPVATTVGDPGTDDQLVTEQGIREGLDAIIIDHVFLDEITISDAELDDLIALSFNTGEAYAHITYDDEHVIDFTGDVSALEFKGTPIPLVAATPAPTCTPKPDATPIPAPTPQPTPAHVDTCTTASVALNALLLNGHTTTTILAAVPVPTPQPTPTHVASADTATTASVALNALLLNGHTTTTILTAVPVPTPVPTPVYGALGASSPLVMNGSSRVVDGPATVTLPTTATPQLAKLGLGMAAHAQYLLAMTSSAAGYLYLGPRTDAASNWCYMLTDRSSGFLFYKPVVAYTGQYFGTYSTQDLSLRTGTTQRIVANASTGMVGIGSVVTPVSLLQLNGTGLAVTGMTMTGQGTGSTAGDGLFVGLSGSESTGAMIMQKENDSLTLGTNNSTRIYIYADGGTSITGRVVGYNGVATEGYGLAPIVDSVELKELNAALSPTNVSGGTAGGTYWVAMEMFVRAADATAGTVVGNVLADDIVSLKTWSTDPLDLSSVSSAVNKSWLLSTYAEGEPLRYSVTVATGAINGASYTLHLLVMRVR